MHYNDDYDVDDFQLQHSLYLVTLVDRNASVAEATLVYGQKTFTATGSAKREPGDPYDPTLGEQLAIARALSHLGEKVSKDARLRVPQEPSPSYLKSLTAQENLQFAAAEVAPPAAALAPSGRKSGRARRMMPR